LWGDLGQGKVAYVKALGGRLTVTVEAGNRVFYEDLVVGL